MAVIITRVGSSAEAGVGASMIMMKMELSHGSSTGVVTKTQEKSQSICDDGMLLSICQLTIPPRKTGSLKTEARLLS